MSLVWRNLGEGMSGGVDIMLLILVITYSMIRGLCGVDYLEVK